MARLKPSSRKRKSKAAPRVRKPTPQASPEIIDLAASSDDETPPPSKRRRTPDEKNDEEDVSATLRRLREKEKQRMGEPVDDDDDIELETAKLEFTYKSDDDHEIDKDDVESPGEPVAPVNGWYSSRSGLYPPPPELKAEYDDGIAGVEVGADPDPAAATIARSAPAQPASSPAPGSNNAETPDDAKPAAPRRAPPKNGKVLRPGKDLETATLTPLCMDPVECKVDNHWVNLFFRFCAERHAMYTRRAAGVARDKLTDDETMTSIHIGNIYRQLDPSSAKLHNKIIGVGDQSVEEVCFRVFLFCMFYKDETWAALCEAATGEVPSWKTFEADMPAMEAALHEMSIVKRQRLWYGGFQIVPPTVYFSKSYRNRSKDMAHYAASLRLVMAIMKAGIPARLAECTFAIDASYVLGTVPTLGGFLGLNILCFLNDTTHFKWPYRDFATCGPGSRKFLQRMFGKEVINNTAREEAGLRWLTDNQWRYWARLDLDPPHEWEHGLRPGMRVLDVENALCWAHRYVNAYQEKGTRSLADEPAPTYDPEVTEKCSRPAWCVEQKWLQSTSRTPWDAEHDEAEDHVESLGDDRYELEKVVARLGSTDNTDGLFRVRWTGWAPEWDTWERESTLREDAEEVSYRLWRAKLTTGAGRVARARAQRPCRYSEHQEDQALQVAQRPARHYQA
jgi:hypothetical protein